MLKKVAWIILAVVLVTAMVVGAFLWEGSFQNVLRLGSFSEDAEILDCGRDSNGDEYRVVMEYNQNEAPGLALLTRNPVGTWEITKASHPSVVTLHPSIGWLCVGGMARFAADGEAKLITESHKVYSGNDAVKLIEIPKQMLPSNIAVEVRQAGSAYVLHLITYLSTAEETEQWNELDILTKLEEAGYIRG